MAAVSPREDGHDEPTDLSWSAHHLAAAIAEFDATVSRRMGLSTADYLALKHLMLAEQPIGPVGLGRLLGLTSGAATGLVDRLEQAGHVRRSRDPHDRRRQIITASPKSRQRLIETLQPLADDIGDAARALTAAEQEAIGRFLHTLADLHHAHSR
jgi:DNA-binding MarR family transcriptional regulator